MNILTTLIYSPNRTPPPLKGTKNVFHKFPNFFIVFRKINFETDRSDTM